MTKLIFFGNEKLATGLNQVEPLVLTGLLKAGYQVEAVVTRPAHQHDPVAALAALHRLPILSPTHGSDLKPSLTPFKADLGVLVAFGLLVPKAVLEQFKLGIMNLHPSLLPKLRGPSPIEQTILNGSTETGVTIMKLTTAMDAGPIFDQSKLSLSGQESKVELASKLHQLGADLLLKSLPDILGGSAGREQAESAATYSPRITKSAGVIDWTKPAQQLEREVRAYSDWPGSRTEVNGQEIIITSARVTHVTGTPGRPLKADGLLVIYCGQDSLVIEKLKPPGKPEMSGRAYLAGHPLK